jgi:hypothetical protein
MHTSDVRIFAYAAVCAIAAAGCASLSGLSSGSGDAAPPRDGGGPAADSADGPVQPEDATPMADGDANGSAAWCASHGGSVFCDDFDNHALMAFWDSDGLSGGGSVSADGSAFVSAPTSFLAVIPGVLSSKAYASLKKQLGIVTPTLTLSFDMRPDTADPARNANVISLDLGADAGSLSNISLYVSASGLDHLDVNAPAAGTTIDLSSPLAPGWIRVFLGIDFQSAPPSVTLSTGPAGSSQPTYTVLAPRALDPSFANGPLRVALGVNFVAVPETGWQVRFDDVLVDH